MTGVIGDRGLKEKLITDDGTAALSPTILVESDQQFLSGHGSRSHDDAQMTGRMHETRP